MNVNDQKVKKENFLNHLAERLDYTRHSVKPLIYRNDLPHETLDDLDQAALFDVFLAQCEALHCHVVATPKQYLAQALADQIERYQGGPLLYADDPRFNDYGLAEFLVDEVATVWQKGATQREINLEHAQKANIGIVFGEYLLAESGTVVVESSPGQGRAIHFLPKHYIAMVPKSRLVSRMTQVTDLYAEKVAKGEAFGSALHFISGPSNSGDIEMVLVEGVHGPLSVTYLVIEDC
ncbi:lactate utilization protein C [uncultured Enterococcus sp.]|uniref:LutC/YkgG family protein n=1 Tax=uncultured Enterococcus sp. TaxID=167972 RepID=UPI0025CB8F15|nr:lactate utilization protein C [uncultured Enterococcus sp.]